jgi:WD40 repeat protein
MEMGVFTGFTGAITGATFDHTEQYVFAGSMDKSAKLWSLKNNKLLNTFTGHIDYINCVATMNSAPKGLTGSSDRTFKEWDFNTLKLSRNVKDNRISIINIIFSLAVYLVVNQLQWHLMIVLFYLVT